MYWSNTMGPSHQCHMGVSWLLPWGHTVPNRHHHTGAVNHPFPGGSLRRHGKALSRYGIFFNSAKSGHWVQMGLWTDCCVDTPLSGPPSHPGRHGPDATTLVDEGENWPYAYIRMNNAMTHAPLSSEGHIGTMTGNLPSQNTCSHLHQLCMWQLLQCRSWVVCPDGLNGGLEPLMFNFKELPLWNRANVGESSRDPSMMDVDLGYMVCMASTWAEDPLGMSSRGTMEQPPLASLATLPLHCNTLPPGHKLCHHPWDPCPNREFPSIGENRTHHPHPSGNSPTPPGGLGTAAADISYSPSPCFLA